MKYQRLRGVKDVLPADSFLWEHIIVKAVEILKLYNYSMIITPTMEDAGLFSRSVGEETDIVLKEMYTFKDKKERDIALRPEGTASIARAYIENSMEEKSNLFYIGQMFRYEKPQKGRDREFYQIGAESFGDATPYKDAEIINLANDILKNTGISGYDIHINSTGCGKCRPGYIEKLEEYLNSKKELLCEDCLRKIERKASIRVLDCKNEKCRETIIKAPVITDYLCDECAGHYLELKKALNGLNLKYNENPRIVRGLDYYTKTVFEFITDKLGPQQNTILAGGRYDDLIHELGGKQTPATGFATGIERMAEVIKADNKAPEEKPMDAFIIVDGKYIDAGFSILNKLRTSGIKASMNFEAKSFKSQMREANNKKARYALIIGENEAKSGKISVKNMADGAQQETDFDTAVKQIKKAD